MIRWWDQCPSCTIVSAAIPLCIRGSESERVKGGQETNGLHGCSLNVRRRGAAQHERRALKRARDGRASLSSMAGSCTHPSRSPRASPLGSALWILSRAALPLMSPQKPPVPTHWQVSAPQLPSKFPLDKHQYVNIVPITHQNY